ncbi:MAG: DNA adenine methylase, partial [Limnochordia bacterium]
RLKLLCDKLDRQGIKFLLSNSATDFIMDLYRDYQITIVQAQRAINSKGDKRGPVDEVLVKNYD